MIQFVGEHYLFLLTLVGAVLSFVASFTGLVSRHKPVLFLAVLLGLGFVVGFAYQTLSYLERQGESRREAEEILIEKAAQRARDNVINEIQLDVKTTKLGVEDISARLQGMSLDKVGTRLVSIQTRDDLPFDQSMAFGKGSPYMWFKFLDWISEPQGPEFVPSLSLTFGAEHYYDSGLLLVYLLTTSQTGSSLKQVVEQRKWSEFSAEKYYFLAFSKDVQQIRWVLFYQGDNLVAFADARDFVRELTAYHAAERDEYISMLLNRLEPLDEELMMAFPSIETAVFDTTEPSVLVADMIRQQLPIAITTKQKIPYVARLERMIKLAIPES